MIKKVKNPKVIAVCVSALLVVGIFFGATAAGGAQETPEEETVKKILVDTQNPSIGDIVVSSEYIGTVEPNQQVYVLPKMAGEVLEVFYSVGDTVSEGDVLAEIDSATLRNTIAQTRAGINSAAAKAQLGVDSALREQSLYDDNIEGGYNSTLYSAETSIQTAEIAVEQAGAAVRAARATLKETREMKDDGLATDLQVLQAKNGVTSAEIALEQAQKGLEQAKAAYDITSKAVEDGKASIQDNVTLAQLNADLTQQRLQLEQLESNLADCSIKAPISGVIEQRNVDPYDMATQSSPAFVISNKDGMTISFKISEGAYPYVRAGDRLQVEKNGQMYAGTVTEVGTMVDAGGMFTVKANIPSAPAGLYSGSSVKIYADTQKALGSLLIPLDAIYYDNGAPFVYIAENGVAKKTQVEVGIYDAENIEVLSGLTLSDRVIYTWNSSLADGAEIELLGEQADAAAQEASAAEQSETQSVGDSQPDDDGGEDTVDEETNSTLLDEEEGGE